MSKPMKIDDHANWTGRAPKGQVFADGAKTKMYSSAEGAGELPNYEQTSEDIKTVQEKAKAKVKAHPMKPGYRN